MKKKIISFTFILLGVIMIAGACFVMLRNRQLDNQAADSSKAVIAQMTADGIYDADNSATGTPSVFSDNPDISMTKVSVNGNEYIGVLEIPAIDLLLPVMSSWSYDGLQLAPCRYSGSVYKHNLVIAAHNYYSHFWYIQDLAVGDEVFFTDTEHHKTLYRVAKTEILEPNETEAMCNSQWDLSLFTCTLGGARRVTVRCMAVDDSPYRSEGVNS